MRKIALLLVLVLAVTGCAGPNKVWLAGLKGQIEVITPEYLEYVAADPELSDTEKTIRQRSVERLYQLLEEYDKP